MKNTLKNRGAKSETWMTSMLLLCLPALFLIVGSAHGQEGNSDTSDTRRKTQPPGASDKPAHENLFNCTCDDDCGKNLADCSCSHSDQMRTILTEFDRKDYSRKRKLELMKDRFGKEVLAVPMPDSTDYILGYVVPPAVVFLGLLFVGGLGWYWVRGSSDTEPVPETDVPPEIRKQIEQEAGLEREKEEQSDT